MHGSSIGGARPKALIEDNDVKYVAKFSTRSDLYSEVKTEYIAIRLAALVDLDVAPVKLVKAAGKMCLWSSILIDSEMTMVLTGN